MSAIANSSSGLGYPGSQTAQRTAIGLCSTSSPTTSQRKCLKS